MQITLSISSIIIFPRNRYSMYISAIYYHGRDSNRLVVSMVIFLVKNKSRRLEEQESLGFLFPSLFLLLLFFFLSSSRNGKWFVICPFQSRDQSSLRKDIIPFCSSSALVNEETGEEKEKKKKKKKRKERRESVSLCTRRCCVFSAGVQRCGCKMVASLRAFDVAMIHRSRPICLVDAASFPDVSRDANSNCIPGIARRASQLRASLIALPFFLSFLSLSLSLFFRCVSLSRIEIKLSAGNTARQFPFSFVNFSSLFVIVWRILMTNFYYTLPIIYIIWGE